MMFSKQLKVVLVATMVAVPSLPVKGAEAPVEARNLRLSPLPVSVCDVAAPAVLLNGEWRFNPAPQVGFEKFTGEQTANWAVIRVPGEWVMQGFEVKKDSAAAYRREFEIPNDWHGRRIKLRCDAVYSDATVWVNGREAGRHVGGFTPFELDVSDLVTYGRKNSITLAVINESLADKLASGSEYARHPLGGITRKIQLVALPTVNLSKLHVQTTFDKEFHDATLAVELAAAKEGAEDVGQLQASLALTAPDGHDIPLSPSRVPLTGLTNCASIPVTQPLKWDDEHPNLYTLNVKLELAGRTLETVSRKIGFRQVEVRGNQFFLNNVPIKLRGVCRHETHPLLGRSLTPELARRDVEIFRDGNCNFIRTSHYPPAEEFIDACDALGMLVEVEAPFCWSHKTKLAPEQVPDLVTRQELEMLEFYRNHPSVTHWSLANESDDAWTDYFLPAAKLFKQLDPSRPINYSSCRFGKDGGYCDMGNHHYPGLGGPAKYAGNSRPITFDEYCHVKSYGLSELSIDPGLRDFWGHGLDLMWERMRQSRACMGGAIWAALDDFFLLPNGSGVGCGEWGPIDGWRRPKPEFWHMKKVYSPLRLRENSVPANAPVKLTIENRHYFTDLSELTFAWRLGKHSGEAKTSAAPGQMGHLEIPVTGDGQLLEVRATSPRGFCEDIWQVALGADVRTALPQPSNKPGPVTLEKTDAEITVRGSSQTVTIDPKTGMFVSPFTGPALLILPRGAAENAVTGWEMSSINTESTPAGVRIRVEGRYAQARGAYTYDLNADGTIAIHYTFTMTDQGKCNPTQIGIAFRLPAECNTLKWRRQAHWSYYPEDHIGRAEGTATAFPVHVPVLPRTEPKWSWSVDSSKFGSNDFRSTKLNFIEASLVSSVGRGLRLLGDGSQHVRSWASSDHVNLLVAQYANEGAAPYKEDVEAHTVPYRPLKAGDEVAGTFRMEISK